MTSPQSATPLKPTDPFRPAAGARILAFGDYQPGNEVTNDDLTAMVDTTDEWIRSRTGIISRRIAGPDESVTDMAVVAGGKALAGSGLSPADIDLVIVATCSTEASIPNASAVVAYRLASRRPAPTTSTRRAPVSAMRWRTPRTRSGPERPGTCW